MPLLLVSLRNAQCAATGESPAKFEWQAQDFVLIRSERLLNGARLEIAARWQLD